MFDVWAEEFRLLTKEGKQNILLLVSISDKSQPAPFSRYDIKEQDWLTTQSVLPIIEAKEGNI